VIRSTGISAESLHLEITESAVMKDQDHSIRVLQEIRGRGVQIDLDDFGTGQSSLSSLQHLPIDVLKLDRSFIADLTSDANSYSMVRAIRKLAEDFHIDIIAEGVETIEQVKLLKKIGCEYGQGYYFSKPLTGTQLVDFYRSQAGQKHAA
jgi:EAL domain-containing protein (putative c-di-GMP-specific phosphodiesterase class I)